MIDVAAALIGDRRIDTVVTGIRPGEKLHEILVSEEESHRTVASGDGLFVISPILPELKSQKVTGPFLEREYSSEWDVMTSDQVRELMIRRSLMPADKEVELEGEFLR